MQHFYINVPPCGRAKTSMGRCATKDTGARVNMGSRQGVISVEIWHNRGTGEDMYEITLRDHGGKKNSIAGKVKKVLAAGKLSEQFVWLDDSALV